MTLQGTVRRAMPGRVAVDWLSQVKLSMMSSQGWIRRHDIAEIWGCWVWQEQARCPLCARSGLRFRSPGNPHTRRPHWPPAGGLAVRWPACVHGRRGPVCARAQSILQRAPQRAWGLSGEPRVGKVQLPGGGLGQHPAPPSPRPCTLRAPQLHVENEGAGQAEGR